MSMPIVSPIAGLSLIVHLIIIGIAALLRAIQKKVVAPGIRQAVLEQSKLKAAALRTASIGIMATIILGISWTTAVAIKTGFKEGQKESHAEYLSEKIEWAKAKYAHLTAE